MSTDVKLAGSPVLAGGVRLFPQQFTWINLKGRGNAAQHRDRGRFLPSLNVSNVPRAEADTIRQLFLSPLAHVPHLANANGQGCGEIVHAANQVRQEQ